MATNVATARRKEVSQPAASDTKAPAERERVYLTPAVDIAEDAQGITVYADLPGVELEGLNVHVEGNDTLVIEGTSQLALPQGARPVYAEQQSLSFRRRFTVSSDLDTAKVDATLSRGVLTVRIPKAESAQPRKIAVKASG